MKIATYRYTLSDESTWNYIDLKNERMRKRKKVYRGKMRTRYRATRTNKVNSNEREGKRRPQLLWREWRRWKTVEKDNKQRGRVERAGDRRRMSATKISWRGEGGGWRENEVKPARCVHTGAPRRVNKRARRDTRVYVCAHIFVYARVIAGCRGALVSYYYKRRVRKREKVEVEERREKIRCASIDDGLSRAGFVSRGKNFTTEMFKFRSIERWNSGLSREPFFLLFWLFLSIGSWHLTKRLYRDLSLLMYLF